jgi:hypothetical protein
MLNIAELLSSAFVFTHVYFLINSFAFFSIIFAFFQLYFFLFQAFRSRMTWVQKFKESERLREAAELKASERGGKIKQ